MNKQGHASSFRHRVAPSWTWAPLVALLTGGCNKPRDWDCEPPARYFLIPDPKRGTGAAPFSIDRPGREVKRSVLETHPVGIRLKADTHRGNLEMIVPRSFDGYPDIAYSETEGILWYVDHPEDVAPMKLFFDGKSERVQIGFVSRACPTLDSKEWSCEFGKEKLYFMVDMTCKHRIIDWPYDNEVLLP